MAGARGDAVSELKELATTMREYGVIKYIGHGVEILLGPPPLSKKEREDQEKSKTDPRARKRAHFEMMLGRNLTDGELDMLPES